MKKICDNIQNIMSISVGGGLMSLEIDQNNDSINNVMSSLQSEADFVKMIKDIENNKV
jgi:hypothetical protein